MREDIKKKVVFCEVAWMKHYRGVTDEDKPMNGGKYIEENGDGGEVYNFCPVNRKCYGYVMHYGSELHIERYDKTLKNHSEAVDMTVVWVASNGGGSKIVGWYEHATMYREWQWYLAMDYQYYDYNFIAEDKNCFLIPEKDRKFTVPRAPKAGKGRGMGQSQVWYADSEYAQEEFIPKVMVYLSSVKEHCETPYLSPEEFEKRAKDVGQSTEQLIEESKKVWDAGHSLKAFEYINLAIDKDECFKTRKAKAELFDKLEYLDEAEEEYKRALYYKEDVYAMIDLMYLELRLKHTFLVIELGEKIRERKGKCENWTDVAGLLTYVYMDEKEWAKAEELLEECENDTFTHDWLDKAREKMEELKKQK